MSTTNIFIARHGETEYNRTNRIQGRGINKSLNETGRNQAENIGRALGDAGIDHIFSSSLHRSKETAEIIARKLKLIIASYPELDEMDFGIIEGRPISEIDHHLKSLNNNWKNGNTAFALDEGESPDVVLKRVTKRTDKLLKTHRGENILFVLHGRLIRILLSHWLEYGLSQMHRVGHQNGALYHLRINSSNKMEPVFLNKIEHLKAGS